MACIAYASDHNGRFAHHILEVLDEKQCSTAILRDPRSRERPPQLWPSGWTAPFDRISEVPEDRRREVCSAVDQVSDICYLGSGMSTSSPSTNESPCVLLYLRRPVEPYGYLVGYVSGRLDWLPEEKFRTALSRTWTLIQGSGQEPPLEQRTPSEPTANRTSEGIRRPADGAPKPSR